MSCFAAWIQIAAIENAVGAVNVSSSGCPLSDDRPYCVLPSAAMMSLRVSVASLLDTSSARRNASSFVTSTCAQSDATSTPDTVMCATRSSPITSFSSVTPEGPATRSFLFSYFTHCCARAK